MTFVYSRVDMNMLASRFIDHHGIILPEINMSPKKRPLQKEISFSNQGSSLDLLVQFILMHDKFIDAKEPVKPEAFGTQLVDRGDSNSPKNYRWGMILVCPTMYRYSMVFLIYVSKYGHACLICMSFVRLYVFVFFCLVPCVLVSLFVCLFICLLGGLHIHMAFDAEIRVGVIHVWLFTICIALIFPRCSMYGSFQFGLERTQQFSFGWWHDVP